MIIIIIFLSLVLVIVIVIVVGHKSDINLTKGREMGLAAVVTTLAWTQQIDMKINNNRNNSDSLIFISILSIFKLYTLFS